MATNGQRDVNSILAQDADDGAAIHSFDSAASPEEKGANARAELKSAKAGDDIGGQELHVQNGSTAVVPTITVEDIETEASKPPPSAVVPPTEHIQNDSDAAPGAFPVALAPAIPDWYRVGWRQTSGVDKAPPAEGEEVDKGVLDMFLAEQFYGAWYHNAALVVFAVFASHFLTRFHFGWGWLFIVLAFCSTYYSTSLERVRRRARDDIQRELVKTRLASEHETADWINNFLDRFWLIYEPVLAATVVSSVDQVLSTNTPAFLDSLRLSTFTLGTKAPRIDKVRTFPKTDDDVIMMDWGISFTPNDVSDLTPRQAAAKVNPKIVLDIRLGKSVATATMPILVEDISFSGLMRIRMKLMSNFPHVQIVDFCFLQKPVIDYVLKPIGGETFGFDIGNIPGLSAFIREITHGTLGPMMYDPNVFTLNLEQMLSGKPLDTAIGVLQVTIHSARGIKGTKIGGGTPDPYIALTINDRVELARTKYKNNTYNPTWMETKFLLVNSLNESLVLNLWDYNDHRKDNLMGSASFELSKLIEDATREGIRSTLLKDGKERGELRYDVSFYPVLEALERQESPETSVGIVRLTLHQAKELDYTKSITGDLNPMAKVYLGAKTPAHTTPAFKHTNNPVWESPYEFLCSDRSSSVITVKILDDRDFLKDPVIGYMSIKLQDLLDSTGRAGRDWFPLSSCKTGKIRVSAEWKPLNMAGSLHGAEQYKPPIGVVKLWLDKATDVKNVEATLGGKSDPYVRVLVNNVTTARTEVKNNNLNPVWDEIVYIPVHSLREHLLLECMDYQHLTRDRSLGSVELHVSDLAKESSDPRYPFESLGQRDVADPIQLDKGNVYKGKLHYKAEFIPALALSGVAFDSPRNELANRRDGETASLSSSDDEHAPVGITINPKRVSDGSMSNVPASPTTPATSPTMNGDGLAEAASTANKPSKGVEMSNEELLSQQSGVIVFNVISGELSKKARVEVLLDDGYWPCFSTPTARSTHAQWEYVGEGFIKEIDFSRVWLRLNEADEGEKDDIIGEWSGDAKPFLQATLHGVQSFTLLDKDERNPSTIRVEARYVPVPVKLDPRETINNQGILRVDLIDGRQILAADRGGKSDPYAVFSLNGERVFKSEVRKKTLNPEWNESFTLQVPSRFGSDFEVELFDWDALGRSESLGKAKIDVTEIEPFEASERTLNLILSKHGEKGQVRVRLMFQPEIIAKTRKNTSTFSTAGRAMTQFGGLPVSAGKGVLHGVANVFKKGENDPELQVPKDLSARQASQSAGPSSSPEAPSNVFPVSNSMEGGAEFSEPGTLRVTVLNAQDLPSQDSKPYTTIRVGDKEFKTKHVGKTATPEWNEAFTFAAGPHTQKLYAWIHDHRTLSRDKDLDEGELDIWHHIQPQGTTAADVFLELRQGGLLKLRLEFDTSLHPSKSSASIASSERANRSMSMSMSSPSRFSIGRSRRPGPDAEE